jgi:hypothetical protein
VHTVSIDGTPYCRAVAWHLVERSNGQTLRGTYETREEAEAFRAELVAEDAGYDDVLIIRWEGAGEPELDPDVDPPPAAA